MFRKSIAKFVEAGCDLSREVNVNGWHASKRLRNTYFVKSDLFLATVTEEKDIATCQYALKESRTKGL